LLLAKRRPNPNPLKKMTGVSEETATLRTVAETEIETANTASAITMTVKIVLVERLVLRVVIEVGLAVAILLVDLPDTMMTIRADGTTVLVVFETMIEIVAETVTMTRTEEEMGIAVIDPETTDIAVPGTRLNLPETTETTSVTATLAEVDERIKCKIVTIGRIFTLLVHNIAAFVELQCHSIQQFDYVVSK
jgi:hypothetical protein